MSMWNYVVTAHKPTNVTHSCVGNFTGPSDLNLIVVKCTFIEIHLFTQKGRLQLVADIPLYGRIAILELFRPHGEAQDFLFIATERYKFCVLYWDAEAYELITREMGDVSDHMGWPTDIGQIGIIDPECRLIGLHLYDGLFKVIPFDSGGKLKGAFNIRLNELQVLDIKFLYGCQKPTIVVLYQDTKVDRSIKTYEVALEDKKLTEVPWPQSDIGNGASLLIPVPMPLGGVIIVGEETIVYIGNFMKSVPIKPSIIKAYGRVDADGSRYLLGDHAGLLYLLVIIHEENKVTNLKVERLGETSIASTISYLRHDFVYVGSSYGDSQLGKLNFQPHARRPYKVCESYVNLGPIVDFCLVDRHGQGQGQVVTCSGAYKDGSLHVVQNVTRISKRASVKLQGITGMWSLRSSVDDKFDTFLVVSFVAETRIFAMNTNDDLVETEIDGFHSTTKTLFCKGAIYNQLVQVTANSVRLVNSSTQKLQNEWRAPPRISINIATANSSQILLATSGYRLVYLEIGNGVLFEVKNAQLEYDISCIDINPIGENPNHSTIAAVGMWKDLSVRIFALPSLQQMTTEHLEGDILPRSVLLCVFEEVPYLLCGLGDGHLVNFRLNVSSGELYDRKRLSLGMQPISLWTYSSKNTMQVFAASDKLTLIYSSNKKLLFSDVNSKDIGNMCPFNTAAFPDSLAIAKDRKLTIGTVDDIQKLHVRSITLGEHARRISYQEQSRTFAICSYKFCCSTNSGEVETSFVHLLDDQTFHIMSTYQLDTFEHGNSILSCSFADDQNMYYSVGTSYLNEDNEPSKGRILVFSVKDGKLELTAKQETKGAVYSLTSFNGKLLAAINQNIQLYRWILRDDGSGELQYECGHHLHILAALYVQTRGDFIVVGDLTASVVLLVYKHQDGTIVELARDSSANSMTAVEILDDDIYLGADSSFNLFTVRKNSEGTTDEERSRLDVVGGYHLGEFINCFRHGSLVVQLPHSDIGQIPTVMFGTVNGVLGIVASLPHEQYIFLEKLQSHLRKVIEGVGRLSHQEWRSCNNENKTSGGQNFVDGDLIESFLDLSHEQMSDISRAMDSSVEELCKIVEKLRRLH